MQNKLLYPALVSMMLLFGMSSCVPALKVKTENSATPNQYAINSADTTNSAAINWKDFFTDEYLTTLIDSALANNQELNITLQEINMLNNEVLAKKGEYLPFLNYKAALGADKRARYTNIGASEANLEIAPGVETPEPLGDILGGTYFNWEVDIWHKLRTAKQSAVMSYLASVEGKNFMVTNLVAEIANSYYELLALDNQLAILQRNIEIQQNALHIVELQKQAAKITELAIRKFQAEVFYTKSLQFKIQQQIIETENRINFLVGRFPQPVMRSKTALNNLPLNAIQQGVPSQLLQNRPDIKQAEYTLAASKLDVKVAKANFYPSISISAGLGLQAFNASYLLKAPESLLYSLAGDLAGPLVNRNAIKATYLNANAKQIQAVYNYEQSILTAFIEVSNQLASLQNLEQSYQLKSQQVEALTQSIELSNNLFKSARADYMEVLMTQRDALESKFELIETKKQQFTAVVNLYKALGGGWK